MARKEERSVAEAETLQEQGAGPALSLPSMLVIGSVNGTKKTIVYIGLVCVMATISGMVFGAVVE